MANCARPQLWSAKVLCRSLMRPVRKTAQRMRATMTAVAIWTVRRRVATIVPRSVGPVGSCRPCSPVSCGACDVTLLGSLDEVERCGRSRVEDFIPCNSRRLSVLYGSLARNRSTRRSRAAKQPADLAHSHRSCRPRMTAPGLSLGTGTLCLIAGDGPTIQALWRRANRQTTVAQRAAFYVRSRPTCHKPATASRACAVLARHTATACILARARWRHLQSHAPCSARSAPPPSKAAVCICAGAAKTGNCLDEPHGRDVRPEPPRADESPGRANRRE